MDMWFAVVLGATNLMSLVQGKQKCVKNQHLTESQKAVKNNVHDVIDFLDWTGYFPAYPV